jgi:hypothetical protein
MAWFKCCDTLFSNKKVTKAWMNEPASIGAWLMCGTWCANQETDGHVPEHIVRMFGITDTQVTALVDAGLWTAVEDGWLMHDFLDYNPSKAELLDKRAKESARRSQRGGTTKPRPLHERSTVAARTQQRDADVNGPVPVPVPVTSLREVKSGKSLSAKEARTRKRLGLDGPEGGNAA